MYKGTEYIMYFFFRTKLTTKLNSQKLTEQKELLVVAFIAGLSEHKELRKCWLKLSLSL